MLSREPLPPPPMPWGRVRGTAYRGLQVDALGTARTPLCQVRRAECAQARHVHEHRPEAPHRCLAYATLCGRVCTTSRVRCTRARRRQRAGAVGRDGGRSDDDSERQQEAQCAVYSNDVGAAHCSRRAGAGRGGEGRPKAQSSAAATVSRRSACSRGLQVPPSLSSACVRA